MKIIRLILSALRQLSFKKIIKILRLALPHPLFSLLTFFATIRAYRIAKKYFPVSNSTDGIGNAYRHALWCCLILMYCCKISSVKKSVEWCKNITNLHEDIFQNPPLQRKMDLHNNDIGIKYFLEILPGIHRQFFETSFFVEALFEKTKTAKILRNLTENYDGNLVYLGD